MDYIVDEHGEYKVGDVYESEGEHGEVAEYVVEGDGYGPDNGYADYYRSQIESG